MGPLSLLRSLLPKTLLKRSILIIVLPLVLVQLTSIYVFLDRHVDSITRNIASNIASSIDLITHLHKRNSPAIKTAGIKLGFAIRHYPKDFFKTIKESDFHAWEDKFFVRALRESLKDPYKLVSSETSLRVYVLVKQETLSFTFGRKRLMSRTTPLVFFWGIGASIFFLIIAIIFMRNQVRPIRLLAEASERFGKGLDITYFKPHGAIEVRQAAIAFRRMQERIKRQIEQRTEMLAGISHDLRTPLTRMKLALAMMPKTLDVEPLKEDITHMESMINEYLAFVRGDQQEAPQPIDIALLVQQSAAQFETKKFHVETNTPKTLIIMGRPQALKRAVDNILSNAQSFAESAWITLKETPQEIHITLDDNGPGIPEAFREDVLKPFFRLESSRNTSTGGIGLGLSIVADIVNTHGGRLHLMTSPQKGLRVRIELPK
jgi:two-component system osmolarity sensor histidine kinase EnvZ